jgi:geranylgeranyl diphosphate synthase type I
MNSTTSQNRSRATATPSALGPTRRATSAQRRRLAVVAAPTLDSDTVARFEDALRSTLLDALAKAGTSPIGEQIRWHFCIDDANGRRGKRLRPRLVMQVAFDEGGTFAEAIDAAVAVECLHNYSLMHDDIEDRDRTRHGRPAVWARFGLSHGVNAGDSMCAVSYLALLRGGGGQRPETIAAMAQRLHEANFAMCAGQAHDIAFETATDVALEDYFAMIDGKTASLFGAACELGALSAGAGGIRADAYAALGRTYGRAFQIRDDVLGVWGSPEQTGKPSDGDLAHRKWVYPVVWALAGPASAAREVVAMRYGACAPLSPADIADVRGALDALGARAAAQAQYARTLREAELLTRRHGLDRSGAIRALFSGAGRPAGGASPGR